MQTQIKTKLCTFVILLSLDSLLHHSILHSHSTYIHITFCWQQFSIFRFSLLHGNRHMQRCKPWYTLKYEKINIWLNSVNESQFYHHHYVNIHTNLNENAYRIALAKKKILFDDKKIMWGFEGEKFFFVCFSL